MYKQYMVFSWIAYDNVEPFQCIDGHTDDLKEAEKLLAYALEDSDENGPFACIFDRIEGKVI
jgi:hypothetical protein